MTSFVQSLFYRGKLIGEGKRGINPRLNGPPRSVAFLCPKCGEVWARLAIDGQPWVASHVECDSCGKLGVVNYPGSLWSPFDPELNAALPYQWLARELEIAIAWHLRYGARAA